MSVDSNWTLPAGWDSGLPSFAGAVGGAPSATEMFFQMDERRRGSPAKDYGAWWWDGQQGYSGQYRVSCVQATGEIYALEYRGAPDRLVVLARLADSDGNVPEDVYSAADALLAGWAAVCGQGYSLGWVLARLGVAPAADPG